MGKHLVALGLATALVIPAAAIAAPSATEKRTAKAECKAERGKSPATREAFRAKYHGFSRCIGKKAKEEQAENDAAHKNAAKECKAERSGNPTGFAQRYGENHNGRNAFGKGVSSKARAGKDEMDADDEQDAKEFRHAANACAAERGEIGREAFTARYGANRNRQNAFGKCVSERTGNS